MLAVLKAVTQLLQDTSELVVIVGAAWAATAFKDRVVGWMTSALSKTCARAPGVHAIGRRAACWPPSAAPPQPTTAAVPQHSPLGTLQLAPT